MEENEIKVYHHSTNDGFCCEIWVGKTNSDKKLWLGRDTEHGGWSYLTAEYHEPLEAVPENIVIVICNSEWKEYYRTGNDRERFPDGFPTFEQVCEEHWNSIKHEHLPTVGTPELVRFLEEIKPDNLNNLDNLNWSYNRYHNIDPDNLMNDGIRVSRADKGDFKTIILKDFDYMDKQYHIVRFAQHHSMCNARWYMYAVAAFVDGKINRYMCWFGYGLISNK